MRQNAAQWFKCTACGRGSLRGFLVKVGAPTVLGVGMFALELVTGALDVQALATLDVRHAQEDAECCAKMVVVLVVVERVVLGALQGALKAVAQDVTLCQGACTGWEAIVGGNCTNNCQGCTGCGSTWGYGKRMRGELRIGLHFCWGSLPVRAIVFLHAKMYVGTAA